MIDLRRTPQLRRADRERWHFDSLAGTYGDTWWGHRTRAGRARDRRRAWLVMSLLAPCPSELLLELGSGAGNFTRHTIDHLNGARAVPPASNNVRLDRSAGRIVDPPCDIASPALAIMHHRYTSGNGLSWRPVMAIIGGLENSRPTNTDI